MILVLTGPTGTGKSKLAISLANKINGEIVNADAFKVYEKLRIATASPTEEEKKKALRQIVRKYSPGFEELGEKYMDKSWARTAVFRVDIEHITAKAKYN